MARILLVRPADDPATRVSHRWAREILRIVRAGRSHTCRDLSGPRAQRTNTERELSTGADCLVFYGHGGTDRLQGHLSIGSDRWAIDLANCHMLAGRLIYVYCCDSARNLGPAAIAHGARAFLGYTDEVYIVTNGAELWFSLAASTGIGVLLGLPPLPIPPGPTCERALQFMLGVYQAGINFYTSGSGSSHPDAGWAAFHLQWQMDHLVLLGDRSATL